MSHEDDDKLDALWRSASAADADRPSAKTRAAILAEAAAAARRREPAANAPKYWMRVVAGVAVVGVGLMLWRQTEVPLPGEMPVAAPMMQEAAPQEDAAAPAPAPPPAQRQLQRPAQPQAQSQASPATQAFENAARADAPRAQGASPSPLPEPRRGADEAERQEMKVTQERAPAAVTSDRGAGVISIAPPAPQAPPVPPPAAPPPPAPSDAGAELLRRHFPSQNASAQSHRLWVVLDAAGNVQLSGELAEDASLDDLAPRIRRETGREPGSWRIENLVNARGQPVELAITRLPR